MPSVYFFRGIRQEFDAKLTLFPYGDIGIALSSDGKGGLKSSSINFGVWNSLNTGTSGSDGASGRIHYEEDFYTTLNLGFGGGVGVATTFTAYTSPNGGFGTIQELSFKVTKAHMLNPYGLLAFEVGGDGSSDGGSERGTYLELGVGPSWPLAGSKATVAVPVKFGFSLSNYYESGGEDHSFGFFDIGALLTVPLSRRVVALWCRGTFMRAVTTSCSAIRPSRSTSRKTAAPRAVSSSRSSASASATRRTFRTKIRAMTPDHDASAIDGRADDRAAGSDVPDSHFAADRHGGLVGPHAVLPPIVSSPSRGQRMPCGRARH